MSVPVITLRLSPAQARLLAELLAQRGAIVHGWHKKHQEALHTVDTQLRRSIAAAYRKERAS